MIRILFVLAMAAVTPSAIRTAPTPQTSYMTISLAMADSERAGIKPRLKPTEYKQFLFLVDPSIDNHSKTGFAIPADLPSAVESLRAMLPKKVKIMIKKKWGEGDAFNCPTELWPQCFAAYDEALSDVLIEIWGLDDKTILSDYFRTHGICDPGRMIDAVQDGLYAKLHGQKKLNYDRILRTWADVKAGKSCPRQPHG